MRASCIIVVGLVVAACAAGACGDPVHSDAVDALGPEAPGEGPGPTHRHGQPCLVCHGGSGPGSPEFSIAGTVYLVKGAETPLNGGTVKLTDSAGVSHGIATNEVGNFYIEAKAWRPVMPVKVAVTLGDRTAEMTTHIGRDGSCASCHYEPASRASVGHVYLASDPSDLPAGTAP
jgi:hypothetical protein